MVEAFDVEGFAGQEFQLLVVGATLTLALLNFHLNRENRLVPIVTIRGTRVGHLR